MQNRPQLPFPNTPQEVYCFVSSFHPFAAVLKPDRPCYEACNLVVDYTDALLADLGSTLLMLYAAYAGPPITREAFRELVQPVVRLWVEAADREAVLRQVCEAYAPLLARARERIRALKA